MAAVITHATAPLGLWSKQAFTVEVLPSVPDARKTITVHADDADHAVWIAERHGYRAYGAIAKAGAKP